MPGVQPLIGCRSFTGCEALVVTDADGALKDWLNEQRKSSDRRMTPRSTAIFGSVFLALGGVMAFLAVDASSVSRVFAIIASVFAFVVAAGSFRAAQILSKPGRSRDDASG